MKHRSATRLIGVLVGVAGVAFCLTLLSRSMRSVQQIGGVCRSGASATLIVRHCPTGVAGILPLSIFAGLVFLGLFVICATDAERSMVLLAWPALFLTLGWNFLDYGLHITGGSGISAGFLVCAILFIIMGAVPLIWLLPQLWRLVTGHGDSTEPTEAQVPFMGATSVQFTPPPSSRPPPQWGSGVRFDSPTARAPIATAPPATTTPKTGNDLAGELERLASLHRRKELTDAEYEAAKQQAIANPGNPT